MWDGALRLDKALKRMGLSNSEIGRAVGVSDSTISRYRSGERAPDPDTLARICQHAGLSADEILGLTVSRRRAADELSREVQKLAETARRILEQADAHEKDEGAS